MAELESVRHDLEIVASSPKTEGTLELIACRPDYGERSVLQEGKLDTEVGPCRR